MTSPDIVIQYKLITTIHCSRQDPHGPGTRLCSTNNYDCPIKDGLRALGTARKLQTMKLSEGATRQAFDNKPVIIQLQGDMMHITCDSTDHLGFPGGVIFQKVPNRIPRRTEQG